MKTFNFYQKILGIVLLSLWGGHTYAQQVLVGGTHFDIKPGNETRAFVGFDDIEYLGVLRGILTSTVPEATTTASNATTGTSDFHDAARRAITDNPSKLNEAGYQDINRSGLVLSRKVSGTVLSYSLNGLKPNSAVSVNIMVCPVVLKGSKVGGTTCNGGATATLKVILNQSLSTHPEVDVQVDNGNNPATCVTKTLNGTASPSGDITLTFNTNGNFSDCAAIQITSLEVMGQINPTIYAAEGTEICAGEQVSLFSMQTYTGATYQWYHNGVAVAGATNPSFLFEMPAAAGTHTFRLDVKIGANTIASNTLTVNAIVCCEIDGQPASRKTVYMDDFGEFVLSDPTGKTYKVWDYTDTKNPVQVTKTTTTPFRYSLANPPLGATYDGGPGPLNDGYYCVAGVLTNYNPVTYNGVSLVGARLEWAGRIGGLTTPADPSYDHSGKLEGCCLFLNCPPSTGGKQLYTRTLSNLCSGKQLFFECYITVFTNSAAGAYNPVDITVKLTEVGNPTNVVTTTGMATIQSAGGTGTWVKVSAQILLQVGTDIQLDIINNQNTDQNGNDLALDDIIVRACSAPSLKAYFDLATLSTSTASCDGTDVTIYPQPSDLVKNYFGGTGSIYYLYQWTKTPTVKTSWKNIAVPTQTQTYTNLASVFTGLNDGDNVYFRVIAGTQNTLTTIAQGAFNEDDPCANYTISDPIQALVECPKCTEPKAITIKSTPAATAGVVKICSGSVKLETNDITPTPAYLDYTITWYKGNKTTVAGTTNGTTANPLTVNYADVSAAGTAGVKYYVRVEDHNYPGIATCQKWDSILVVGNPVPTVTTVPNQILCAGDASTAVTFGSSVSGATFKWANSNTAIGLAAGGNGNIAAFTATNTTNAAISATITVTPTANGCPGPDSTFTITVNPKAAITLTSAATTAAQTRCVNEALTNITYSLSGGATGATVTGLPAGVTGSITTPGVFTISGTPTEGGTFNYKIVTSGHTAPCTADSVTGTITVNKIPTVDAVSNQTLCAGDGSKAVSFDSSVSGTTFAWTNTNTAIGLAASGNGNIAVFTATNTTNAAIISTITVTPKANGCTGPDSTFTITINPKPVITLTSVAGTDAQTVCQNEAITAITYSLSGGAAGATVAGLPAGVTGSMNTGVFTISGTPTVSGSFTYTITTSGHVAPCTAVTATGTLTVNEIPAITNVTSEERCGTGTVTLGATASTGTVNWYAASTGGVLGTGSSYTTPSLTSTTSYWVDATANGCTTAVRTEVKATIKPIPLTPTVTSHISCPAKTSTNITWLSLVTTYTGTLKWYDVATSGSDVGNPGSFDATVSQTKSYWVTQTENGCESERAEVKVDISTEPANPTIAPYDECAAATGITKGWDELVTTAGTMQWFSTNNDADLLATPPAAFNTGTVMPLTTYYVIVVDAQGCQTNRVAVTAQVKARPTAVLSGDATICKGDNTDLTVNFTGTSPFKFIYSDGTTPSAEIPSSTGSYTIASLNPTTTTTYNLVSLSDAQCAAVAADLSGTPVVTVNDRPTVGAVAAIAALCSGDSFTPTDPTVTPNGSLVSSTYWEIGQGITFTQVTFPYTVSDADNGKTLRFSAVSGCGTTTSETTLTVNPLPTVPVTTIAPFCQGSTPPALPTFTGLTSEWKDESDVVTTVISSAVAAIPGIHNYTVKVTDGNGCVSLPATIPVEVISNPLAPGINNDVIYYRADIGSGNKFKDLLLQDPAFLTQAAGTDLLWSEDGGATWSSTAPVPSTPDPADFDDKTYTYLVKQKNTASPNCESQAATATARVYLISVPKVKTVSYCIGETSVQLDEPTVEIDPTGGYVKSDFELRWYNSDNLSDLSYTTTNPTPSTNVAGGTVYWVSQFNKKTVVESSRVPLRVYVYDKPVLNITDPAPVCYPATVNIATGSVWNLTDPNTTLPPLSSSVGYFSGTQLSPVSLTTAQAQALARVTPAEETYYIQAYLTLPSGTQCASDLELVKIQIHDLTPAISGSSQACPETDVTLTADPVILYNPGTPVYSWIRTDNGLTGTGNSFNTGQLPATSGTTVVINMEMSQGACPATAAPAHTITIGDGPVVGTMTISEQDMPGKTQTFTDDVSRVFFTCGNDFDITADYDNTGNDFIWKDGFGTQIAVGTTLPTRTLSGGTAVYTLEYTNQCPTSASITVYSVPVTAASDMPKMQLCENEGFKATLTVGLNDPEGLSPQIAWYHDGQPIAGETGASYRIVRAQPDNSGTYTYTVTNRGCTAEGTVTGYDVKGNPGADRLDVSSAVTASLLPSEPICEGESVELGIAQVNPSDAQIVWIPDATISQTSADGKTITASPPFVSGSGNRSNYSYKLKIINQYCGLDTIVTASTDRPLKGNKLEDFKICEGQTVTLDGGSYESETYTWTSTAYDGKKYGPVQMEKPSVSGEYYLYMERGSCEASDSSYVTVNSRPIIERIDSIGPRDREIIAADAYGTPPFVYGVDLREATSDSRKLDLTFGRHSFYIEDVLGCRSNAYDYVVEAPRIIPPAYFSPNGDGQNDRWDMPVLREVYPEALVTIYDRYGKKIAEYRGSDMGWDGVYDGKGMPSTDYWYVIDIDEIDRQFVGHFTLIR